MIGQVERSFLDVRAHGFARVAVVIPEVRVADPAWNVAAHLRLLAEVRDRGAQYAVCPELGVSGYTIRLEAYQRDPGADLTALSPRLYDALLRASPVLFPRGLGDPAVWQALEPLLPRRRRRAS